MIIGLSEKMSPTLSSSLCLYHTCDSLMRHMRQSHVSQVTDTERNNGFGKIISQERASLVMHVTKPGHLGDRVKETSVSWGKSKIWQSQRDFVVMRKDVYWNELVMSPVQVRVMSLKGLSQLGLYTLVEQKVFDSVFFTEFVRRIKTIEESMTLKTIALLFVRRRHRAFARLQTSWARAAEMLASDWVWRTSWALATEMIALAILLHFPPVPTLWVWE